MPASLYGGGGGGGGGGSHYNYSAVLQEVLGQNVLSNHKP